MNAFNTRMSCPAPLSVIMEEDEWPVASTSSHHIKSLRRRPNMITSQSFHAMFAQEESSVSSSSCPSSPSSSSSGSCYSTSPPSTPEPCTFDDHLDKRSNDNECENDLEEAYDYYTQEFTDLVSLPASYQETCSARPESVYTLPPMPSASPVPPHRSRPRPLTIIRPPPRMSIPVDETDSSSVLMYYIDSSSTSGSVYSSEPEAEADDCASNISLVDFEFEMTERAGTRFSRSEACAARLAYPSTHEEMVELEEGRVLRSKWSTSTIGSVKRVKSKSLRRRMLSPMFSPKSMGFSFRLKVPATPSSSGLFSPTGPQFPGRNLKESGPKRRTSTSTNGSEASASSEASSGLRRKPIPLELFLKV